MASDAAWNDPPPPEYFLQRMRDHHRIRKVESISANRHDLTTDDGRLVKVFLTDTYTFSESDYAELRAEYPEVDCIVSASSWNHFTPEAERAARTDKIGAFSIGEFMGAVHFKGDDFALYNEKRANS